MFLYNPINTFNRYSNISEQNIKQYIGDHQIYVKSIPSFVIDIVFKQIWYSVSSPPINIIVIETKSRSDTEWLQKG